MGLVVRWYDAFCFAIVAASVVGSVYVVWRKERAGDDDDDDDYQKQSQVLIPSDVVAHQVWSTCWRGLHPGWLLGSRVISFFVLAGFLSWDIQQWGASIFIYYTEWTFALVMLYFAIGSIVSVYGCWLYANKFQVEAHHIQQLNYYQPQQQALQLSAYLLQTAYQSCAGAVILTDVVFWGIIVPLLSNSRLGLNLLMGCMHTVNIALLLIDTSINRLPFPWFRLAYFVLWSSAYVVFQWVIHLFGFSWWPYPFLELSTPSAPLWYFILAVFHIACYGLYALIIRVKDSLFSRLFPDSYIKSCRINVLS